MSTSSPCVSRSLGVVLEETSRASFGPRYVLCELDTDSGELVKSSTLSARARSNEWRTDLKNVQKHFDKDRPVLVAFFAPRQTISSPTNGNGSREVFKGHGYKSGGLPDFLTSSMGSPSAAKINRTWQKHGNNNRSSSSSSLVGTRAMIVAHIPDGISADLKSKYTAAKGVLKSHLGAEIQSSTEHRHTVSVGSASYATNGRGGVDYGSGGAPRRAATQFVRSATRSDGDKHIAKLRTANGPLNLWEQAAIQSERDARQIARETPKQGGFLAAMHEAGGIMGVPVARDHDVVEELRGAVMSAPNSPRRDAAASLDVQRIVKSANKAQPEWAKTADKMVKSHRKSSGEDSNSARSLGSRSVSFGSTSSASSFKSTNSSKIPNSPYKTPTSGSAKDEKPFALDGVASASAARHRRTRSKTVPNLAASTKPKTVTKGGRPLAKANTAAVAPKPTRQPIAGRTRTPKAPTASHEKAAPMPAFATKTVAASPKSATKQAASPKTSPEVAPKKKAAAATEKVFLDEWAYSIDMPHVGAVLRKAGCETLDDVKSREEFTAEELEKLGMASEAHRFKLLYLIEKLKK